MIAHPFAYRAPATQADVAELLAELGEQAAPMAGGTWLVPHMSRAERRPTVVIDLRRLGLSTIATEGTAIALGACTTYEQLKQDPLVREHLPLLRTMAQGITGGRSITGQGTIGGAACYANPASDVPACLLALGARMRLVGRRGSREVDAGAFFTGPFRTARRADEFLSAILVDRPIGKVHAGYHKLKLSGSSWPIVTAACCVVRHDDALHVRVAIGAAAAVPALATATIHVSQAIPLEDVAAEAVMALAEAWSDELADAEYRLAVAPEVARRAAAAARDAMDD